MSSLPFYPSCLRFLDNHCAHCFLDFNFDSSIKMLLFYALEIPFYVHYVAQPYALKPPCSLEASCRFSIAAFTWPFHQLLGLCPRFPLCFLRTLASSHSNNLFKLRGVANLRLKAKFD